MQGTLKSMQINQNDVGRSVEEALRLLDAYQFVEKNGVVCPANWKPGGDTMEADPDGSLKYFSKAESTQDEHAFGETLTAITSRAQYEEATSGDGPVVVRFPSPCFFALLVRLRGPREGGGGACRWTSWRGGAASAACSRRPWRPCRRSTPA